MLSVHNDLDVGWVCLCWVRKTEKVTRKVLCGSFLCAIYRFSFIHLFKSNPLYHCALCSVVYWTTAPVVLCVCVSAYTEPQPLLCCVWVSAYTDSPCCVVLCLSFSLHWQPLLCCVSAYTDSPFCVVLCHVCLCFSLHWATAPVVLCFSLHWQPLLCCVVSCVFVFQLTLSHSPCCVVFQLTLTAPFVLCHVCLCFSCHQASQPTVLFQLSCSPSCVVCVSLS